jgi:hypothetical protein
MIAYNIRESPLDNSPKILRLGFSIWAKSLPKNYLSIYPKAAQNIQKETGSDTVLLCALVDDIWPRLILSRTCEEQQNISDCYIALLPTIGFHEVYLASNFMKKNVLEACLSYSTKVTISEFWKLLPQSKKNIPDNLTLVEIIGFLWHINLLGNALEKYQLTGLLAGIRSEFFYLTARKLLPPHDIYFVNTS